MSHSQEQQQSEMIDEGNQRMIRNHWSFESMTYQKDCSSDSTNNHRSKRNSSNSKAYHRRYRSSSFPRRLLHPHRRLKHRSSGIPLILNRRNSLSSTKWDKPPTPTEIRQFNEFIGFIWAHTWFTRRQFHQQLILTFGMNLRTAADRWTERRSREREWLTSSEIRSRFVNAVRYIFFAWLIAFCTASMRIFWF